MNSLPAPGIGPGPDAPGDILDALEYLDDARCFLGLLAMSCRHEPDDDQKAVSAGVAAALDRLTQAETILQALAAARPSAPVLKAV